MYTTYSQTVELHLEGVIIDTKILPCPIHPDAKPNTSPYGLRDKNIKCPDGSIICWDKHMILKATPSGISYIWWNPESMLNQCLDNSVIQGSYYRRFATGEIEARHDNRIYNWSRLIPGSPLKGIEIISWWDRSTGLWEPNVLSTITASIEKEESIVADYEYDDVPCQGCGDSMPRDDVNQYRRGYWCSRGCAFYEWM
jgi:hypothetical protein